MSFVFVVGCQVKVFATGQLRVRSSPTESSVSDRDLETSATRMKRPRPSGAVEP